MKCNYDFWVLEMVILVIFQNKIRGIKLSVYNNKDILGKPYERDEKSRWVKDRVSFTPKSYIII